MSDWYNLPVYYDVSFSHEMAAEKRFLQNVINQHCSGQTPKVLEPACGSGRLLLPLARQGFECTGLDLNINALQYLKKN